MPRHDDLRSVGAVLLPAQLRWKGLVIGFDHPGGMVGEEFSGEALAFGDALDLHRNRIHSIGEMIQPLFDPGLSGGIAGVHPFPAILDPLNGNGCCGDYQHNADCRRRDDFQYRDYLGSLHLIDR
jgi:hypothetical protein